MWMMMMMMTKKKKSYLMLIVVVVMAVVYKIMNRLIAKMNYPIEHHLFVTLDKIQNHTFVKVHDGEAVYMDGLDIDETLKSGYEEKKHTKDKQPS